MPGFARLLEAPIQYLALTSALGLGALVAGVVALATRSEALIAALVAATVVLWVLATARPGGRGGGVATALAAGGWFRSRVRAAG